MKCMVVISCLLAVASAGFIAAPHALIAPASVSSQYHAQDELGQYSYGYSGGPSAKHETKTFDGITRGGYSYIDGHGLVQTVNYVSDPYNGFRVAATNLPVGPSAPAPAYAPVAVAAAPVAVAAHPIAAAVATPQLVNPVAIAAGAPLPVGDTVEVAAAKAAHYQAHAEAHARLGRYRRGLAYAAPVVAHTIPARSFAYSTVEHAAVVAPHVVAPHVVAAPIVKSHVVAAPVAVAAPIKSFGYSTVSAHAPTVVAAAPAVVAAPAVRTVVAAAPAVVATAPVAVAAPVKSFAYSSVSAHAPTVVAAAPAVVAAPAAHTVYSAPAVHSTVLAAPAVHSAVVAPAVHSAVVAPASTQSQYHAQDELGQYSYGYSDLNSAKHESRAVDGTTLGGYSYVDGHGIVQSVNYHADHNGFKVAATNLPVA